MIGLRKLLTAASAVVLLGAAGASNANTQVFTELALLMDVSGSVDSTEFALQRTGYVNAFNNSTLHNLIANNTGGLGIAVSFVQWSGAREQSQLGNTGTWYHLTDATSSMAFATAINGFPRAFAGQTAPGSAINFITPQFGTNAYVGIRKVIDVSGDGSENDGDNTANARNAALAAGVDQVNGLAIGGSALLAWYNANIKSPNGFVLAVNDFSDFENALLQKIQFEITGVIPVPAALPLLASGLLAFGFLGRRRQHAA